MNLERFHDFAEIDEEGCVHIHIPAMLERLGWLDTPTNRAVLCKEMTTAIRKWFPDARIVSAKKFDGTQN